MAEYIERDALIKRCEEVADCDWNKKAAPVSWSDAYEHFVDMLEETSAVDVVEVVRCKDCKRSAWRKSPFGVKTFTCELLCADIKQDDFCCYGERRTDNATDEAEPVKHGRWLQPKSGECFCSECKTLGSPHWKRCPICEAKMDGGENNA